MHRQRFRLGFVLHFNDHTPVANHDGQPVRVAPEAYYLFETPAAGVSELCDAFKVRYVARHCLRSDINVCSL